MHPSDEAAQIAADKFVEWLRQRVIEDATGSAKVISETQPFGTFWLGRLASQDAVFADGMDSRGDRLDPCSIGLRFCPEGGPPWSFDVEIRAAVWKRDRDADHWKKCGPLTETISIVVEDIAVDAVFGEEPLRSALRIITGADSLSASKTPHRARYTLAAPTMLRIGLDALRALCKLANALPRPGPRWSSVAAGRPAMRA